MSVHGNFRFPANSSSLENPYCGWFGMVMKNGGVTSVAQGGVVSFKVATTVTSTDYISFRAGTYGMAGCGGNTISALARHKIAGWLLNTIASGTTGVVMFCGAASVLSVKGTGAAAGKPLRYATGSTAGRLACSTAIPANGDSGFVGLYSGSYGSPPRIAAVIYPWRY